MVEYLRMFLIALRRRENTPSKMEFRYKLLILSIVGAIIGIILDIMIPFNFYTNAIRGVIANIVGFSIFSYGYLMSVRVEDKRRLGNTYYKPIRKRFSFKQRANISIMLVTLSSLVILFTSKQDFIFTLKSATAIAVIIASVAFARKDRNEFIKNIYEIPDSRDVRFAKNKKKEKLKEDSNVEDD